MNPGVRRSCRCAVSFLPALAQVEELTGIRFFIPSANDAAEGDDPEQEKLDQMTAQVGAPLSLLCVLEYTTHTHTHARTARTRTHTHVHTYTLVHLALSFHTHTHLYHDVHRDPLHIPSLPGSPLPFG